ncbi:macrophage mannose receptor 1-like [Dicentrarchus labrax]|uniref:macrophage mannose receptor 1-like n=1 Tax=Dicentrarchus labrax TaxID=13489 RepID=UPI0021F5D998|nr:macrophage mannose receptor 1-like [Dicentrarchus labrax]
MDFYVTMILLFFGYGFNSCSQFPKRKYYYVNMPMNWTEAQHYCREKYTDLATIESTDDISRLKPDFLYAWAWIGLKDDPKSWKVSMGNDTNSWRWSATGLTSKTGYHNWKVGQPNNEWSNANCVSMGTNGKWYDRDCKSLWSFVCYNVTNQTEKTYVFISALKSWNDAQAYCREHYTDLPMIENSVENNEVYSAAPAEVWIGLYRVPWTWSDNTQSSFRQWLIGFPNNFGGHKFCVDENFLHTWEDGNCDVKLPFICHQVSKLKTTVRMKFQTDADITDPATNAQILQQLAAVLTSQGWTDFNLQWKIQPTKQMKTN